MQEEGDMIFGITEGMNAPVWGLWCCRELLAPKIGAVTSTFEVTAQLL